MNRSILKFRFCLVLLLPLLSGCAFFNALYNGWQAFNKGVKTEEEMFTSGSDTNEVRVATQKDYERAIKKAEKAISYYPKSNRSHDDAFFLKGRTLYQMGHYAEAVPVFKTLQKHYPDSRRIPHSWLYLGKSYAGSGDFQAADETYSYIIDNFPELNKNQEILILRSELAIMMKGKSQAITFLIEALENITDPNRRLYIIDKLGGLYIDLKMYDKALEYLKIKPDFDRSYKTLFFSANLKEIRCYRELQQFDEAESLLLKIIDNRHFIRHITDMRYELAILYLRQKRMKEARKILKEITANVKTSETIAKSWYELSLIQIDYDGKIDDGKVSLKKVIEISTDAELREKAKRRLSALDKIKKYSDSITAGVPDSVDEWFLQFKMGERYWLDAKLPDSALAQFEHVLDDSTTVDSIRVKTLFSKGWIIHEIKKDSSLSESIFSDLIAEYPHYEEAKEAQRLLGHEVTLMTRRDSASLHFDNAEKLRLESKEYDKNIYYSYLLTALKFPEIKDIAAKSLYAAGWVINQRDIADQEVDTAAAKIYGRLCREYPESEQCKDVKIMLENGKVKGFVDSYTKFLEEKGSDLPEDSTALAQDTTAVIIEETVPLVIPDFSDWF